MFVKYYFIYKNFVKIYKWFQIKINNTFICYNVVGEENYHPIGRRQSSLHSTNKTPPNVTKKKPGLLKGIGSMFR